MNYNNILKELKTNVPSFSFDSKDSPEIILVDLLDFFVDSFKGKSDSSALEGVSSFVEKAVVSKDSLVNELISAAFLERLFKKSGDDYFAVKERLGFESRKRLGVIEGWHGTVFNEKRKSSWLYLIALVILAFVLTIYKINIQ